MVSFGFEKLTFGFAEDVEAWLSLPYDFLFFSLSWIHFYSPVRIRCKKAFRFGRWSSSSQRKKRRSTSLGFNSYGTQFTYFYIVPYAFKRAETADGSTCDIFASSSSVCHGSWSSNSSNSSSLEYLSCERFESDNEVKDEVKRFLNRLLAEFYDAIQKLEHRPQKCFAQKKMAIMEKSRTKFHLFNMEIIMRINNVFYFQNWWEPYFCINYVYMNKMHYCLMLTPFQFFNNRIFGDLTITLVRWNYACIFYCI